MVNHISSKKYNKVNHIYLSVLYMVNHTANML
nr:MAG TPA: hypothetical protein [Caudoviricetes sp.]